jgi:hypothetical protein
VLTIVWCVAAVFAWSKGDTFFATVALVSAVWELSEVVRARMKLRQQSSDTSDDQKNAI